MKKILFVLFIILSIVVSFVELNILIITAGGANFFEGCFLNYFVKILLGLGLTWQVWLKGYIVSCFVVFGVICWGLFDWASN